MTEPFQYGDLHAGEAGMLTARLRAFGIEDVFKLMILAEKMGWITRPCLPRRPWQRGPVSLHLLPVLPHCAVPMSDLDLRKDAPIAPEISGSIPL